MSAVFISAYCRLLIESIRCLPNRCALSFWKILFHHMGLYWYHRSFKPPNLKWYVMGAWFMCCCKVWVVVVVFYAPVSSENVTKVTAPRPPCSYCLWSPTEDMKLDAPNSILSNVYENENQLFIPVLKLGMCKIGVVKGTVWNCIILGCNGTLNGPLSLPLKVRIICCVPILLWVTVGTLVHILGACQHDVSCDGSPRPSLFPFWRHEIPGESSNN